MAQHWQGTAEVIFSRRSDALAVVKRYNNVLLDGKPMQIEIIGTNTEAPPPTATFSFSLSGTIKMVWKNTLPGLFTVYITTENKFLCQEWNKESSSATAYKFTMDYISIQSIYGLLQYMDLAAFWNLFLVVWLSARKSVQKEVRKGFDSLVLLIGWILWKERNDRTFNNRARSFRLISSGHLRRRQALGFGRVSPTSAAAAVVTFRCFPNVIFIFLFLWSPCVLGNPRITD